MAEVIGRMGSDEGRREKIWLAEDRLLNRLCGARTKTPPKWGPTSESKWCQK